jgi:hypothetical protein
MLTYAAHAHHFPHLLLSNRRILLSRYVACARLSSAVRPPAHLTSLTSLTYLASPHSALKAHIPHITNSACCVRSPIERYQPCGCPLGAPRALLLIREKDNGSHFAHQICGFLAAVAVQSVAAVAPVKYAGQHAGHMQVQLAMLAAVRGLETLTYADVC